MFEGKNTSKLTLEEKIQLLMDERDIGHVINRYARAASRGDLDIFKSCFWDDAFDHHPPSFEGTVSDFYKLFDEAADKIAVLSQYYMANLLIELDGDVAHTECQAFSPKILHPVNYNDDQVMRLSGSRYLHRFERRNGEWRIAVCWWIYEWAFFKEVPPQLKTIGTYAAPSEQKFKPYPSRRDKTDLSYTFNLPGGDQMER